MVGRIHIIGIAGLLLAAVACSEAPAPAVEADGQQVHVPVGVADVSARAVPEDGPRAPIRAMENLSIATGVVDSEFAARMSIAVDGDGRVYALDLFERSIAAYTKDGVPDPDWDPDASAVTSALALDATEAGLAVIQWQPNRLSLFDHAGTLTAEHSFDDLFWKLHALPDGTFLTFEVTAYFFSRLDSRGQELRRFTVLSGGAPQMPTDLDPDLLPEPAFAVADGAIYVTGSATYEIVAFSLDGDPRFVLRVSWNREPIPTNALPDSATRGRRAGRAMRANVQESRSATLPEHYPALSRMAVDGHGRLYVFPWVSDPETRSSFPVDVYGPDGQLLVNGTLPFQGWDDALGDHVYRVEPAPAGPEIVRYQLRLPSSA